LPLKKAAFNTKNTADKDTSKKQGNAFAEDPNYPDTVKVNIH
jgi:hypothetical protein